PPRKQPDGLHLLRVADLLLEVFALRDFLDRPLVSNDGAGGVDDRTRRRRNPEWRAVLSMHLRLEATNEPVFQQRLRESYAMFGDDVDALRDVLSGGDELVRRFVAEHARQGRVGRQKTPVGRALVNALDGVLEEASVFLF